MKVALLGRFDAAATPRLTTAGHEVVEDAASGSVAAAAEGADLVVTWLAEERELRRVYSELARTASPGQVFADLSPVAPALHEWCALVLPAFVGVTAGQVLEVRGEPAHVARARTVLEAATGAPVREAGRLP